MNGLSPLVAQMLTALFGHHWVNPVIADVVVGTGCVAVVVGVLCRLLPPSIDAVSRLLHTVGRRRGQDKILDALALRGDPDHLVQSLAIMNEASPLDAPDAHLQVGPGTVTAIPQPRSAKKLGSRMVSHDTSRSSAGR